MDIVCVDRAGGSSEQLLQERLAITHAAGGAAGDQRESLCRHVGPFCLHDLCQTAGDCWGIDCLEVKPLAA